MTSALHIRCLEAKSLPAVNVENGFSDPYLKFKIDGKLKKKSQIVHKATWPVWNNDITLMIPAALQSKDLEISIWDYNWMRPKIMIGRLSKPLQQIKEEKTFSGWLQLLDPRTGEVIPGAQVRISMCWDFDTTLQKWNSDSYNICRVGGLRDQMLTAITEKLDEQERKEDAKKREFSVHIVTWNVGNAAPPQDLDTLVPKSGYDIVCIGTQECKYDPRKGFNSCKDDWIGSLKEHFGPTYKLLAQANMWQIRQAVFVRTELFALCSNVGTMSEATGIAHVMGNKGGTVVTFCINDLSLCFVNAHLAAHQDKVARRNEDVAEIIEGAKLQGDMNKMDITSAYHHVFWNGDLNYRLDYGDQGSEKEPSEEQFKQMVQMIEERKFEELFKYDQLVACMAKKQVFIGWQEGKMDFEPTFKVARTEQLEYNPKRSPAWCDRILWKSIPGYPIRQTELGARLKVATSDHKPVYSTFAVADYVLPCSSTTRKGHCYLVLTNVKATGLPSADSNGKSDPYIQFRAPFIKGHKAKTSVIPETLNPEWQDKDVPKLDLTINNPPRLEVSRIFLRVFDYDAASQNDFLCSGVLFLKDALKGKAQFVVPLFKGGLPAGEATGSMELHWRKRED